MSFLETITGFGNDVLVPIKDIKLIWVNYSEIGWEIHIKGEGEFEWVENFGKDEEKKTLRYKMIKYILGVESEEKVLSEIKKKKSK